MTKYNQIQTQTNRSDAAAEAAGFSELRMRQQKNPRLPLRRLERAILVLILFSGSVLTGCADNTDSSDMKQRQDAAMKDPFSYGPNSTAGQPVVHPGAAPQAPPPPEDNLKSEWGRFWNP